MSKSIEWNLCPVCAAHLPFIDRPKEAMDHLKDCFQRQAEAAPDVAHEDQLVIEMEETKRLENRFKEAS